MSEVQHSNAKLDQIRCDGFQLCPYSCLSSAYCLSAARHLSLSHFVCLALNRCSTLNLTPSIPFSLFLPSFLSLPPLLSLPPSLSFSLPFHPSLLPLLSVFVKVERRRPEASCFREAPHRLHKRHGLCGARAEGEYRLQYSAVQSIQYRVVDSAVQCIQCCVV